MKIPDIATRVTKKDRLAYNGVRSHRIDHWMKAVPVIFKPYTSAANEEMNRFMTEMFLGFFKESHPDWEHEYELHYCEREDATHVTGSGAIIALDDKTVVFTHEYVDWSEEQIERHRKNALFYVQWEKDDPFHFVPRIIRKGKKHTGLMAEIRGIIKGRRW